MRKKKKSTVDENYLEKVPVRPEGLSWKTRSDGAVTLEVENKGLFNKIAQVVFFKPRISYIHLDKMGSFIWPLMDGEKNLAVIADEVKSHFGEDAEPLYERLIKFFKVLESYGFVKWVK